MKGIKFSFLRIVSVLTVLAVALGMLVSCSGSSAYDIAVKNGFKGSETEWLESLRGLDGENGKDGKDGKDGVDGENGKDGENGLDGENGKDGISSGSGPASATAVAIRSAVSIFCNFEIYEYIGYGRDPIITDYVGAGAGVIYKLDPERGDAYVITNHHVVYDADSVTDNGICEDIELYLYGLHYSEMCVKAKYVGGSSTYDIAVLKVEGSEILKSAGVCAVTLANSDEVTAGELAVAIGNPESEGMSVTSGIVSVDSEYVRLDEGSSDESRLMRIDTPVNHGNSGGGLFNIEGHLIGLVNAKLEAEDIENIGYAIPSNIVYGVAENIIKNYENASRSGLYKATLGIMIKTDDVYTVFDEIKMRTYIRERVVVSEISSGAAANGVLEVGDVILSISCGDLSREVNRRFTAIEFLLALTEGDEVVFKVERDGAELSVKVTLSEGIFTRVA